MSDPTGSRPRVLVVADQLRRAMIYAQVLQPLGQVVVASSLDDAASMVGAGELPAAILCHVDRGSAQTMVALESWAGRAEILSRVIVVAHDREQLLWAWQRLLQAVTVLQGPVQGPQLLAAIQARLDGGDGGVPPAG